MSIHIAIQDPNHNKMARLPTGQMVTKAEAGMLGYTVARDSAHAEQIRGHVVDASAEGTTYLDAVLALPEAKERPRAAARLASAYSFKSMPLDKASLFLSGLSSELEAAVPVAKVRTPTEEAKLKAKVEAMMPELHKRAVHGDKTAQRLFTNTKYALSINAASATPFSDCLRQCEINPDAVK